MMNVKVNSASQISQSCSCILSFHRCSSIPRLCFCLRHYALPIIFSCVTLFTAEKASFRIRLNLIQCRQTFALPHKTQRERIGIFSGIFGDSEKESKTKINVVNVYADKNNPQGRKIAVMLYYSYMKLKMVQWINFYNNERLHGALLYLTPEDYFAGRKEKTLKFNSLQMLMILSKLKITFSCSELKGKIR